MTLLDYSKKVVLGDITVRDGLQHEEKFIPTDAKLWLAEQLVLAGFKRIEVTNFGNPRGMPQFKDADELMIRIRGSKKIGNLLEDVEITTVTIRERAVERAIQAREEGWGPDRILFMVSTSEAHHKKNSGLSLEEYWKMCEVYTGKLATIVPEVEDPWLVKLLAWADDFRRLSVWANADRPQDARRGRDYGAEGIGLCRTEHIFFEAERLPLAHRMIMTDLPVIIRLIDPPLHEFLPNHVDLIGELADLKIRLQHIGTIGEIDNLLEQIKDKDRVLKRVESLREDNPMLGLRGVRLGIHIPELTTMQVRAIFEAACLVKKEGVDVHPEVMIPLTSHVNELRIQREVLETEARKVMQEQDIEIDYKFGTMLEIPRAALTADKIAEYADFVSFGTNDLTQTTFGISRDDAETGFLIEYMENRILPDNPFVTIDRDGVGELMDIAVKKGRAVNPELECGICGEHGGDPQSVSICHELGLTYVSCSPFRVPVARLAAAQAALGERQLETDT